MSIITNINIYQDDSKWCDCPEDHDSEFYDDGVHDEVYKHHWRCTNCNKITQIG